MLVFGNKREKLRAMKLGNFRRAFFYTLPTKLFFYLLSKTADLVVALILGLIISFFLFQQITRQIPGSFIDARVINSVTQGLGDKYSYKVLTTNIKPEVNPSIIVWGNDKNAANFCLGGKGTVQKKPILQIYKRNDTSPLALIPFFKQEYKLYRSFDFSLIDRDQPDLPIV